MSGETYIEGALYRLKFHDGRYTLNLFTGGRFVEVGKAAPLSTPPNWSGIAEARGPLRVVEPGQVVLDLTDESLFGCWAAEHGTKWIVDALNMTDSLAAQAIARQIEAQTKPPRIPEPGWGAVVEAGVEGREGRFLFSCVRANGVPMWQSQDGISWVVWASLIDPVVKRGAWVSMGWKEGLA